MENKNEDQQNRNNMNLNKIQNMNEVQQNHNNMNSYMQNINNDLH